jgi:hypothetical protein
MDKADKLTSEFTAANSGQLYIIPNCRNNPIFHLELEDGSDDNQMVVDLRGPKEYSIGFELAIVSSKRQQTQPFEPKDSGPFRQEANWDHNKLCVVIF